MLFYKLEREYWCMIKTFLMFLNKYPVGMLPELEVDEDIQDELDKI